MNSKMPDVTDPEPVEASVDDRVSVLGIIQIVNDLVVVPHRDVLEPERLEGVDGVWAVSS